MTAFRFRMPLAAFLLLSLLFGSALLLSAFSESEYPELAYISSAGRSWNFADASAFFERLAEKKGALYAYEVLRLSPLPPGTDLHLLGHVVGDELYKQEGIEGIALCSDDFRNACSHSIVIGALFSGGEEALSSMAEICKRSPGGGGAYTMCFHGLGHGVLAYVGYELPRAFELCKMLGTEAYQYREYTECVGGTIMEMIGGVHDRAQWERKALLYFKKEDPLYPCNAPFTPPEAQPLCYTYLTPHLFEAAGASLANPGPPAFEAAFRMCSRIPPGEKENRIACSGGLGKEFVVLAQARDIRDIANIPNEALVQIGEWCALAEETWAQEACIGSSLRSLHWGGENDSMAAVRFCSLLEEPLLSPCFEGLIADVFYYEEEKDDLEQFCGSLPGTFQSACFEKSTE